MNFNENYVALISNEKFRNGHIGFEKTHIAPRGVELFELGHYDLQQFVTVKFITEISSKFHHQKQTIVKKGKFLII